MDKKIKDKIKNKIKKMLSHLYPETDGNIEYIFDNGDTVLIRAIKSRNKIFIHNILQYTNKHNNSNNNGYTALIFASKYGFLDIVKLLVEKYHVDIYKLTSKYKRASNIAKDDSIKEYLEKMEKKQYALADMNYDPNPHFKLPSED